MKSTIIWLATWITGTSRFERLSILILMLALALDFGMRAYVSRDPSHRRFQPPSLPQLPVSLSTDELRALLKGWTPSIETPKLREPEFLLRGIVFQRGIGKAAVVVISAEGQARSLTWFAPGDALEDWVVSAVNKDTLVLTRGEERREIKLFVRDQT